MHAATCNTFNLQRHLISRRTLRTFQVQARADWNAATAVA
jgi:putative transposase